MVRNGRTTVIYEGHSFRNRVYLIFSIKDIMTRSPDNVWWFIDQSVWIYPVINSKFA